MTNTVPVLIEELEGALSAIQDTLEFAYESAGLVCCRRGRQECCGDPVPEWTEWSERVMETLGPAYRTMRAIVAAHTEGPTVQVPASLVGGE